MRNICSCTLGCSVVDDKKHPVFKVVIGGLFTDIRGIGVAAFFIGQTSGKVRVKPLFAVHDVFLLNSYYGIKLVKILTFTKRLLNLRLIAERCLTVIIIQSGHLVFLVFVIYDRNFEQAVKGCIQVNFVIIDRRLFRVKHVHLIINL